MATKQFSLRVGTDVFNELDRQAREMGESRSALAERYIAEGVRMKEHPGIYFRETGSGDRLAALVGTRLDVFQVLATVRADDNSIEGAAEYFDLPESKIRDAVRYAAAHPAEVEEVAERHAASAERAYAAWLAEQELLAR